jgi:hypothetical protein
MANILSQDIEALHSPQHRTWVLSTQPAAGRCRLCFWSVDEVTLATQWPDLSVRSPLSLRLPWWVKSLNLEETTSRAPPWGLQIHTPSNIERNVPSIVIYLPRCGHTLLFCCYHTCCHRWLSSFLTLPKDAATEGATSRYTCMQRAIQNWLHGRVRRSS